MNRTLLLFIVDFLFLNLIALTRWERSEPSRPREAPVNAVSANAPTKDADLVEAMRQSLADEQQSRQALEGKLAASDSTLALRERAIGQLSADAQKLTAQLVDAQRAKAELGAKAEEEAQENELERSRLTQLQKEFEEKRAEAERERLSRAELERAQAEARRQIENLRVAVAVGEHEKELLSARASDLEAQVQAERSERARVEQATSQLAKGVGQLAQTSGELTKEIRDNTPVPSNELFSEFLANRVGISFSASRRGLFGEAERNKDAQALLVSDGRQVYAILEVEDSPFSLREVGADWERFTAKLARKAGGEVAAARIDFLSADPRVVAVPVTGGEVASLGAKVYPLASDPFRFPEALLISADGRGFGELGFKVDQAHKGYVKVDNRLFKRLFGDFATSRGDLVLSRSGELLGIMVNSDYCLLLGGLGAVESIPTGDDIVSRRTGTILDSLSARVLAMPLELQ